MTNKQIFLSLVLGFMFCISILLNIALVHDLKIGKARQDRYHDYMVKADRKIEELNHKMNWGW